MKPTQVTWWAKCLGYTLSVHMLLGVIMFLYACNTLNVKLSLVLLLTVCLIAVPLYFFVKGNADKTPLYMLVTCVSHVVWLVTMVWLLGNVLVDWEALMLGLAVGVSVFLFMVVLLMDTVIWVWHKIFK